jgi:hypothetical protein
MIARFVRFPRQERTFLENPQTAASYSFPVFQRPMQ